MIIVLFHILYLFGKFVYQNYRSNRQKAINDDTVNTEHFKKDYMMKEPKTPQNFDDKPIRFFPPAYVQRYVAVTDVLNNPEYQGKLRKVVDFGCAELDFLLYLKNVAGVEKILGVDIDRTLLEAYKEKAAPLVCEYLHTRTTPLEIEICEGSVTQNDKKLEQTDAVTCIELIEHLYPDTLNDLPYNIFGYIKPKLVVITTPNADFNVLFPNFTGLRHYDHKFEWTRQQFQDWATNVTLRYPDYIVTFDGICKGPEGTEHLGCCTQMAVFHRVSEKDSYCDGMENLYKTVAKYEYPFRVDNRSDEEKILDEATYYIRHLSYQNSDMEEEVPLKKILDMLQSFHISVDILKTILEEANWRVEDRELGPVVLIPPHSTFSDYSAAEDMWNEFSVTDEDDWNREPGPPMNSDRFLEEDSVEMWDNQNWDQEPSVIIAQNNFTFEGDSYLFNEDVLLPNVFERTGDSETSEEHTKISSKENLGSIPSIDRVSDSLNNSAPLHSNKSTELSDFSFTMKLDGVKENSFFDTSLAAQDDIGSITTQKFNHTLDHLQYMSVSRASTSPEPYLLQAVKMDQHLQNDSMCNQSMSSHWMLNNSLEQGNTSIHTAVDINNGECKSSPKRNFNDYNQLHSIYLNTSYNETENSDIEHLSETTSTTCFNQNQMQSVRQDRKVLEDDSQLQLNSSISLISNASVDRPMFTSSPEIVTKANIVGKKRRSLDYKELTNPNNTDSLRNSNEVSIQSNSDINISTASIVNLNVAETQYNKLSNSNENTLTSSDTSTIVSTLNEDKETVEGLRKATSLSGNRSVEENEILKVNLTIINNDKCSNFNNTEKSTEKQNDFVVPDINNMQSVNCDTKTDLTSQQLIVKSEPHGEFVYDTSDGKTEQKFELHNTRDLTSNKPVNSTEMSCNYAKDISNLEITSLVSNLRLEDTRDVQSTTVLKSVKQFECNTKSTFKNINPNAIEVAENIELKPSSPETVETPPNSWSPEIMDSGYPNSASAQDMTPEYDLSSIAQDRVSDSESPSIAEAPRLGIFEVVEVENGDLVNNNRDGEGNNMIAAELNDLADLQPLIDVLENDLENENDIYVVENGFPIWLLRILNMANPIEVEIQMQDHREEGVPNRVAGNGAEYVNMERDEGFDSSSEENSDLENNEMRDHVNNANENALIVNVENDNASNSDSGSEQWVTGDT